MSYILDALRKADAQRERDPTRGIHAQPLHASLNPSRAGGAVTPWLWIAAALAVAAVSAAAWYLFRDSGDSGPARRDRAESMARAAPATGTIVKATVAPVVGTTAVTAPPGAPPPVAVPAPVAPPSPMPATSIEPAPAPSGPLTTPAGDSRVTTLPMMRGGPQPPMAGASAAAPAAAMGPSPAGQVPSAGTGMPAAPPPQLGTQRMAPPRTPAAPAPTPAISAPIPAAPPTPPVAGLPADAPKLVLSGGVYSTNAAQRMLIVNGQVFSEGSEVGPGVVLEEVRAKTVVLRFRGSRYTVGY